MKYHSPDPLFYNEYLLVVPHDNITLVFNSKFESANLYKAVKITDYEYMLYLHSDTNTSDQNHWYYFSVKNPRKTSINFKITNMLKKDLLYMSGMKPCVWSQKLFETCGIEWHRDGYNISYTENKDNNKELRFIGSKKYFTLSFTYDFKFEDDIIYFAYAIPYTYTQLSLYLSDLKNRYSKILRINTLCKTLCGNICEMITITNSIKDYVSFEEEAHEWGISSNSRKLSKLKVIKKEHQEKNAGVYRANKHEKKKGIVLTARAHSGEPVSSYMLRGAIDFLVSNAHSAKLLRRNFVFKIVPMLNIDGCKYGNYRCSLLGVDLNRRWNMPSKALHPTIYYTKKMIETFQERHEVMMVCDMHGHTKKRNVFMYGCGVRSYDPIETRKNLLARVVPYLMSLRNKLFSYKDSHFRMENDRKATARVVLWESFGIAHSYTMEASFFGPSKESAFGECNGNDFHMKEKHLESLGMDLCKLCLIFCNQASYMRKVRMTNDYLRHLNMIKGFHLSRPIRGIKIKSNETLISLAPSKNQLDKISENTEPEQKFHYSRLFTEILVKTKQMHKENKINEHIELTQLEENVEVEVDESGTDIYKQEDLWDAIDISNIEPDINSGGSDSDCSIENFQENDKDEISLKYESESRCIKKKTRELPAIHTPQPIVMKNINRKRKETSEKADLKRYISNLSSPKSVSPKKNIDSLQSETPIIPHVFIFPEDKNQSEKFVESFGIFQKNKDSIHLKDSFNIKESIRKKESNTVREHESSYNHYPKKLYKLRSKINNTSCIDKYAGYLDMKKSGNEDRVRSSLEKDKIFNKIRTHKLLNDLFSNGLGRAQAHSVAISSRYKIEKIYFSK